MMRNPRTFVTNIVSNIVNLPDVDPPAALYFNDQKTLLGTYVNSTTVTFSRGFAVPPNGLPSPTAANFDFYVNGTLVERLGIVSFTDNITTSTLVINPTVLQFSFEPDDKIISIGKFN
jgi:hypothetical protein